MMLPRKAPGHRPRVESERESQILDAALDLLAEVGYDRMTMDAVAAHAKASKATLYRRWSSKSSLVVDAILRTKEALQAPEVFMDKGVQFSGSCTMAPLDDRKA